MKKRVFRPLKGHAYHDKTDAELQFIVKDAREAGEAVRGHDVTAENKYADQVNDALTVMGYRAASAYRVAHG